MSNPIPPEEQYLSTTSVAQIFDVSVETVISWIKKGQLDAISVNGRWRIRRASVQALGTSRYGSTG